MSSTIGAVIANAARGAPDATAVIVGGQAHTFAEVDRAGTAVAHQLVGAGIEPGEVALAVGATSFAMVAHFVGCARAGVIFAPMNPALDQASIDGIVATVEPRLALVEPGVAVDLGAVPQRPLSLGDEATDDSAAALPAIAGADPHVAFFTSGSTGAPKAALLSHGTSVLRSHPGAQLEPRGPALCPYPLFHMGGWTIALQQWHARAAVVFVEGTAPTTLADALRAHDIERFNAIPALWSRLAEHAPDGAFPRLRFADTGTSPTSVELLATIERLAPNAHVRVFYGSTEAGNVASLHHADLLTKPGRCGQPSVLTEIRLADDGELQVRGPLLFDGYLGAPDATRAAFDGEWYRTGDRAELDEDGYLSIVGRVGTTIRSGGESITPDIVEAAIAAHPAVDAVAVFGVPDEQWGEIVAAAVVASGPVTLDELRAYLGPEGAQPLAGHQHPRRLLLVDAIPRTAATQQVDRRALRVLAAED